MLDKSQRKLRLFQELMRIQTEFPPFHKIDPNTLERFRAIMHEIEGSAAHN